MKNITPKNQGQKPAITPPANKKQVLGRGLSALLGEMATEVPIAGYQSSTPPADAAARNIDGTSFSAARDGSKNNMIAAMAGTGVVEQRKYREVSTASITPNPKQPRKNFNQEKLQELVESLKMRGVIQPLLVRPHPQNPDAYELVAGERRWRAAQMAGLHLVPVIVKDLDNAQTLELSLIENLHRDDLNAIEEAEAFQRLIDEFQHSHESLSKILGKSRSALTNDLRLLTLPSGVKELIRIGKLSAAHGRNLVGVPRADDLAMKVLAEQWSVRKLEQEVKNWKGASDDKATASKPMMGKDAQVKDIENKLEKILGLKVAVQLKKNKSAGAMTIWFDNGEQLTKVAQLLSKK